MTTKSINEIVEQLGDAIAEHDRLTHCHKIGSPNCDCTACRWCRDCGNSLDDCRCGPVCIEHGEFGCDCRRCVKCREKFPKRLISLDDNGDERCEDCRPYEYFPDDEEATWPRW